MEEELAVPSMICEISPSRATDIEQTLRDGRKRYRIKVLRSADDESNEHPFPRTNMLADVMYLRTIPTTIS